MLFHCNTRIQHRHVPPGLWAMKLFLSYFTRACSSSFSSFTSFSLKRSHSAFSHLMIFLLTVSFLCRFRESMKIRQGTGRFWRSALHAFSIAPGLTTTQRDQCRSLLMGMKMNFFSKILIFFFAVHDMTCLGPAVLLTNVE